MNNSRAYYKNIIKEKISIKIVFRDFFESFFFGGILSVIGQAIYNILLINQSNENAKAYLIIIFIGAAAILTGLGFFDKLENKMKMGLAIPITGFSNSITASMIDFKREGLVCGIGSNAFKLAGSVILYGTLAGIVVGIIRFLIEGKI